ncbi:hypothetical protein ACLOJK_036907 [Asimina triloba]
MDRYTTSSAVLGLLRSGFWDRILPKVDGRDSRSRMLEMKLRKACESGFENDEMGRRICEEVRNSGADLVISAKMEGYSWPCYAIKACRQGKRKFEL